MVNSIVTYISDTKKAENQDKGAYYSGIFNAVLVADGIGTSTNAKEGAEFIIERAETILKEQNVSEINLQGLFVQLQRDLQAMILEKYEEPSEKSFRTTLIIAIETEDKFIIGYLGNGAILHVRGNITTFRDDYYIPWVCTNYLNPHTIPKEGKEALYGYFGFNKSEEKIRPTILEVHKDNKGFGDILIICTDGIYSNDQNGVAKDAEQNLWVEGTKSLELLLNELKIFLKSEDTHKESLDMLLASYLSKLKDIPNGMTDDCTMGIIISEQAIEYQKK